MGSLFGAIGSMIPGAGQYFAQQEANKANKDINSAQMGFQANMSNTSHQREVADLKAAGLNPMLSAGTGGASTPPGAGGQMGAAAGDILSAAATAAEIKKINATTDLTKSQKNKTNTENRLLRTEINKADTQSDIWSIPKKGLEIIKENASKTKNYFNNAAEMNKSSAGRSKYFDSTFQQPSIPVGKPK